MGIFECVQLEISSIFTNTYRYGFNGMERDDEMKGSGNSYDFGARIYDPRLGRWLSLDPLQAKYPKWSPYTGMGDNPVFYIDVDGKYFTGNTQKVKDLYAIVSRLVEKGTGGEKLKQFKTQLELMDETRSRGLAVRVSIFGGLAAR